MRAAVFVGLLIPAKLTARQRTVFALALVHHGYMRCDALVFDHPPEQRSCSIRSIANQATWLHAEAFLHAINHRLGRFDFFGPM